MSLLYILAITMSLSEQQPPSFKAPALLPDSNFLGFDTNRLALLNRRLKEQVLSGKTSGTVTLVVRNGKTIHFEANGWSNIEKREAMSRNSMFQIWSMTKPVTATAVAIAAEEGLLNLDDPIEKYLPSFKTVQVKSFDSTVPLTKKPTIRHLLTHTSGISSNDPGGISDDEKFKLTLKEYASRLGKAPLETQPGSTIAYSGVGFSTAAAIVEIVSKMPFEKYVQLRIFDPLGMKNTHFFLPSSDFSRLATTYGKNDGDVLVPFAHDATRKGARFANGAGGLYSTAEDMMRFILAFTGQKTKKGLSPASIRVMTRLQTGDLQMDGGDERGFGLGWSVVRNPGGQMHLKSIGTFGHTGAFGTEFWHDPKTGITAVYLTQGFGLSDAPRKSFTTMVNAAFTGE